MTLTYEYAIGSVKVQIEPIWCANKGALLGKRAKRLVDVVQLHAITMRPTHSMSIHFSGFALAVGWESATFGWKSYVWKETWSMILYAQKPADVANNRGWDQFHRCPIFNVTQKLIAPLLVKGFSSLWDRRSFCHHVEAGTPSTIHMKMV